MRKLLEVTHEAFVDSGIDYKALRGSPRVGVYLGCCGSEVHAMWLSDYNNITGYEQTGCTLSMFANRLSFFFDFKGPSKAVDTGGGAGRIPELACLPLSMFSVPLWHLQFSVVLLSSALKESLIAESRLNTRCCSACLAFYLGSCSVLAAPELCPTLRGRLERFECGRGRERDKCMVTVQ